MGSSWKYIISGFIILLAQILISDFINIWPMLYFAIFPIFIISLPLSINRSLYMLIAMFYGFCIDFFADGVIGLNAAALVALAYTRLFFAKVVLSKANTDSLENQPITTKFIEIPKYTLIVLFAYFIFFAVYLLLDSFNNSPLTIFLLRLAICVFVNTILTLIIDLSLINKYL
ncbi:MAG: hypothetical protein Q4B21_03345, partial [Bacteroidia bacterium]|nr:hypothetical protein [Bacteroidia bacterium]